LKAQIKQLVSAALDSLKSANILTDDITAEIVIERARDKTHGDFACNLALTLAKPAAMNPRQIAEKIVDLL